MRRLSLNQLVAGQKSGQNIPKNRCRTTIPERMVETPAELPFIEDRVVCLSHNQAARSGQVTLSSGVGDRNPTLFGSGYTSRGPARDNWPRRVGADWQKHIRSLFPLLAAKRARRFRHRALIISISGSPADPWPRSWQAHWNFRISNQNYCRDCATRSYRDVLGDPDHCMTQSSFRNYLSQRHRHQPPVSDPLSIGGVWARIYYYRHAD